MYSNQSYGSHALSPRRAGGEQGTGWSLEQIAGRLVEISGAGATAPLTLAFGLVLQAQQQNEPVAWITRDDSLFYPPDAAEGGVDLDALTIVRVPDGRAAARAADQLIRSGAFGLVVLDLGAKPDLPPRSRLVWQDSRTSIRPRSSASRRRGMRRRYWARSSLSGLPPGGSDLPMTGFRAGSSS